MLESSRIIRSPRQSTWRARQRPFRSDMFLLDEIRGAFTHMSNGTSTIDMCSRTIFEVMRERSADKPTPWDLR